MGGLTRRGWIGWTLCALATAALLAAVALLVGARPLLAQPTSERWVAHVADVAGGLVPVALAITLVVVRPRDRYSLVWAGLALSLAVTSLAHVAGAVASVRPALPGQVALALLGEAAFGGLLVALVLVLLWFPDGAAHSPRWRWLAPAAIGCGIVAVLLAPLRPGVTGVSGIALPWSVSGLAGQAAVVLVELAAMALFAGVLGAAVSLVLRYRGADGERRLQLKWVAYGAALTGLGLLVVALVLPPPPPLVDAVLEVAVTAPLFLGVAIALLRHRLYDLDRLVARTLVYGLLSAAVIGLYVGTVGYLGVLLGARDRMWVSLAATGLVAVAFAPAREKLQTGVDRLLFGRRDDGARVLLELGAQLEAAIDPQTVGQVIVDTVAETLRLRGSSLWVAEPAGGFRLTAQAGTPTLEHRAADADAVAAAAGAAVSVPLRHAGHAVGLLCLQPRRLGESLTERDHRLAAQLAARAGQAVHAHELTEQLHARLEELERSRDELARSRDELVRVRDAERRRIHRDLHDGIGPTLAGVRLHLEAAITDLELHPDARSVLERVDRLVDQASGDLRGLIHDLYPPELRERGLVDAIRAHVDRFAEQAGLHVELRTDVVAPPGPDVEVAVLRIVQEALLNVYRHAGARHIEVELVVDGDELHVEVRDDGRGVTRTGHLGAKGAGLHSMRERAELLGGRLEIAPRAGGGTRVAVSVPMGQLT